MEILNVSEDRQEEKNHLREIGNERLDMTSEKSQADSSYSDEFDAESNENDQEQRSSMYSSPSITATKKSNSKKKGFKLLPHPPKTPKDQEKAKPIRKAKSVEKPKSSPSPTRKNRPQTAHQFEKVLKKKECETIRPKTTVTKKRPVLNRPKVQYKRLNNHVQEAVRLFQIKKISLQGINRASKFLMSINHRPPGNMKEKNALKTLLHQYNEETYSCSYRKRPSHFNNVQEWQEHLREQLRQIHDDELIFKKTYKVN